MIKKETLLVLEVIEQWFPNFIVDQKKLDIWHMILKDFEFDSVMTNLQTYTLKNEYPPKVKDLVYGLIVEKSNIPSREETLKVVATYEVPKEQRMSKEEIRKLINKAKENIKNNV